MTTWFFGQKWDAPVLDGDAEQIPTPVGEWCATCRETIIEGDRGIMRTCHEGRNIAIKPVHMECDMLPVLGHMYGVCQCTGYFASRASALALLANINAQRRTLGLSDL